MSNAYTPNVQDFFSYPGRHQLVAFIDRFESQQDVAADLTSIHVVTRAGRIAFCDAFNGGVGDTGDGEDLTIDVKVNGVSIIDGGAVNPNIIATSPKGRSVIPIDATKLQLAVGDVIEIERAYTAGGGTPTEPANVVRLVWE